MLTLGGILSADGSPEYTVTYLEPNESALQQADGGHTVKDFTSDPFESDTPTAKPMVTGAAVDGTELTITFDLPLKNIAPASAFTIGGQTGVTVTDSTFNDKVVTLTLSPAVSAAPRSPVSYAKPNVSPRIEARNNKNADSFDNQAVTNNTVAPVPEFSSAMTSTDGATLTIAFSLALDEAAEHTPDASTFSLSGTGASVDSIEIDGSTVSLSLSPRADVGETITVGYTPPTDAMAARLQSAAHAQAVLAFTSQPVANHADGKPRPLSAEVDGASLTISFDRPLDSSSTPALTAFSIAGTSATVTTVSFDGNDLTLTLGSSVNHTETVTVSYSAPSDSPLKRDGEDIQGRFVHRPRCDQPGRRPHADVCFRLDQRHRPHADDRHVAPAAHRHRRIPDKSTFTLAAALRPPSTLCPSVAPTSCSISIRQPTSTRP